MYACNQTKQLNTERVEGASQAGNVLEEVQWVVDAVADLAIGPQERVAAGRVHRAHPDDGHCHCADQRQAQDGQVPVFLHT